MDSALDWSKCPSQQAQPGLRRDVCDMPVPKPALPAAVMALVIFFVPDSGKGVAEMVRVVRPGGTVATYVWDVLSGGSPTEPIQAEMRAMGITTLLPPSAGASRVEALRNLWSAAGLGAVETREMRMKKAIVVVDR